MPEANQAAIGMMIAAGCVMVFDAAITRYTGAAQVWSVLFPAFLIGFPVVLFRFGTRLPALLFLFLPMLCGLLLTGMSLAKRDAGAAAMLTSTLPVIYGGAVLRPAGSYAQVGLAVANDAVVLFALTPGDSAARVLAYVATTQTICSIVLTRGNTARRRLTERLAALAGVDTLTGLVTRRVLDEAAQGAITAGQHAVGTALMLIDVDKFKTINDTYGHPVGDDALKHLAEVIAANTRPDCVIGRLGGDELAVLLPGCGHDVAVRRAEQLVEAVRRTPLPLADGTLLPLSVSIGVAHAPAGGDGGLTRLYASADESLYDAKRGGRDRVGR
ncbi:GGDEF domain-containing protein [Kineosporia sp. J2-2]|uniref:GGDEF domain-containing protein n=1 Tax=Kineosporia corallincola TaxID=2835133 RepID=A0ABS5TRY8_9ACTN|nr:GGDEF domain-containing protein [Kineosporia corallincola]MBT0773558.1 GGDEF domain-containing protein [Kineosporia corallincola]